MVSRRSQITPVISGSGGWPEPCVSSIHMALSIESATSHDPRAISILAKTIAKELRANGFGDREMVSLASELLGIVTTDVKVRRSAGDAE